MKETMKLQIPDGYEFDRVENGEVINRREFAPTIKSKELL